MLLIGGCFFVFLQSHVDASVSSIAPSYSRDHIKNNLVINEVGFQCDSCRLSLYVSNLVSDVNLQSIRQ